MSTSTHRARTLVLAGLLFPGLPACTSQATSTRESLPPLVRSDSVAAAAAVVRHAAATGVGAYSGVPPVVICIATKIATFDAVRTMLDPIDREVVPVDECGLHSSREPALAPAVRRLATLQGALILRLDSIVQSPTGLTIDVQWDAGYHYGGAIRCAVMRSREAWVVRECATLAAGSKELHPRAGT